MRLWFGILLSVFFHAALFLIPVAVSIPTERSCENLELVIVQEAREGSTSAETQAPTPGGGEPPATSAQSVPESVPQPEEPRDTPQTKDESHHPEDEPAPTMLAQEVPKPPQPIKKPPKRIGKPPRSKMPEKVQPPPKTVSQAAVPVDQPTTPRTGPEPGLGASNAQTADSHSSSPGGGGRASEGPVDSSFGSGDGPRFVSKALPKYPRLARELGKEGTVLLRLTIDERGRLIDVEVVKRAGSGFDEEAVRAVKSSTFRPATRGGKPVMCTARLPIRFVLRSNGND